MHLEIKKLILKQKGTKIKKLMHWEISWQKAKEKPMRLHLVIVMLMEISMQILMLMD